MQPTQIVQAMYDAFRSKDSDRLRDLLHPEIRWNQCQGFPGGANHVGVEAVLRDVFGKLNSEWDPWRVVIDQYVAQDDKVVVLGKYVATHGRTKKSVESVFAHVYTVRGGQIIHFHQITDTAPLVQASSD